MHMHMHMSHAHVHAHVHASSLLTQDTQGKRGGGAGGECRVLASGFSRTYYR